MLDVGDVGATDAPVPTEWEKPAVNPFDDPDAMFLVLVNDEGQHSLWPDLREAPAGWHVAHEKDSRDACLKYVEQNWTDMRPTSLVTAMEKSGS